MFSLFRGIFNEIQDRATAKASILVIGIDGAGKTTLVEALLRHALPTRRPRTIRPTNGLNTEMITDGYTYLRFWDIGGNRVFRTLWGDYLHGASAVLYVVNGAQEDRIHESRKIYDDFRITFAGKVGVVFLNSDPSILELFPAADQARIFFVDIENQVSIQTLYDWLKSTAVRGGA
jgi:GTPase SAR1 family protein